MCFKRKISLHTKQELSGREALAHTNKRLHTARTRHVIESVSVLMCYKKVELNLTSQNPTVSIEQKRTFGFRSQSWKSCL